MTLAFFPLVTGSTVFAQKAKRPAQGMERSVARLDTVNSLSTPLVLEIARFGDAVIPRVVEKIRSGRELTVRNAQEVFRYLPSEKAIRPLLEAYQAGSYDAIGAIEIILRKKLNLCRRFKDDADPDRKEIFRALLSYAIDGVNLPGKRPTTNFSIAGTLSQNSRVIITPNEWTPSDPSGLLSDQGDSLPGGEAGGTVDEIDVQFRDVCIHSLKPWSPSAGSEMAGQRSGEPQALAILRFEMSWKGSDPSSEGNSEGGTVKTFWIKEGNRWSFCEPLPTE